MTEKTAGDGRLSRLKAFIGPGTTAVGWKETAIAGMAALLGMAAVYTLTSWVAGPLATVIMVASMGAAAVLLFAVPHGALSQPWPVFGGQLTSALVGVTAAQWLHDPALAAGVAVGGSIAAMQLLRCIHPPGGATALIAVTGGPAIHELGYGYVLLPVLANTAIIFLVAVVTNYPFPWRRYPIGLVRWKEPPAPPLASRHLQAAVRDLNVVVDITPDELDAIARSAIAHATQDNSPLKVLIGDRRPRAGAERSEAIDESKEGDDSERERRQVTLNVVKHRDRLHQQGDNRD